MKVAKIFTYNDGPWYTPAEAMGRLGHQDGLVQNMVLKVCDYQKRRLFSLKDVRETQLQDDEFLRVLARGFTTMGRALVEQYHRWRGGEKKRIQSITVINSQGIPKPGFDEVLRALLAVPDVPVYQLTGINCGSTILALQHLHRLRKSHPLQDDECDLLFSIEVPSSTLRVKQTVLPLPYFVYDMIVSDGAGLVVIESERAEGLNIIGHQNFFYPKLQGNLSSRASGRQIEHGASPEVAEDLGIVIKNAVSGLLSGAGLKQEQVKHWILHPGGVIVVNRVCEALGLNNGTMQHALDTIRDQGNSMSSLILYVMRRYFESNSFESDDYGVVIGMAPGFEIQTLAVRYAG